MRIKIADLNIEVANPYYRALKHRKSYYSDFFSENNTPPDLTIRFNKVTPKIQRSKIIFHDKSLCHVIEGRGQYYYCLNGKRTLQPIFSINKNFNVATVYKKPFACYGWFNLLRSIDVVLVLEHLNFHSKGLLMHACGIECGGRGFMFLGPSGAGKTTVAQLLDKKMGTSHVLSDEKIIFEKKSSRGFIWGTPWSGRGEFFSKKGIPLNACFFLEKAHKNKILPLDKKEAYRRVLANIFCIPWSKRVIENHLDMVETFVQSTDFFSLSFALKKETPDFLLSALKSR